MKIHHELYYFQPWIAYMEQFLAERINKTNSTSVTTCDPVVCTYFILYVKNNNQKIKLILVHDTH